MTALDQDTGTAAADFLAAHESDIIESWLSSQIFAPDRGYEPQQAQSDCHTVLSTLAEALRHGAAHDPAAPSFSRVKPLLSELVTNRSRYGQSASETAAELHALKEPVLRLLSDQGTLDVAVAALLITALDTLRLAAVESALTAGADVIAYQQQQLMELSTPVIKLWDSVLAVPLIGTLDSTRSQVAMENLLQAIVDQQAQVAILDITGVPSVDTMVAQHLLKTAMAARLMGAECIISGIRPQIAQTMVQLGIDLGEVTTRANLADALAFALGRIGLAVSRTAEQT